MEHLPELACVAVAGAVGALCRLGVAIGTKRLFDSPFPYETLAVNVAGCFVMGLVMPLALQHRLPPAMSAAITVGFLGAFTTFSAFGFATLKMLEQSLLLLPLINVLANVILGLLAAWAGLGLGRLLTRVS